jgi:hypothetical protein
MARRRILLATLSASSMGMWLAAPGWPYDGQAYDEPMKYWFSM